MFNAKPLNKIMYNESDIPDSATGRNQVKVGSMTSHGGVIITGSSNTTVNGVPLSRIGDLHACPIHGINSIVSGSPDTITTASPNARVGDLCACGAVIVTGSPDTFVNK